MWFAYLYRRAPDASTWVPDPDEVAAAATEDACITALLVPPFDERYELGVDALPPSVPDIRGELLYPVPRLFARVDLDDRTGQTYDYVSVVEDPAAPVPQPPHPLPRAPLEDHSVAAVHLLPAVGTAGQLLALDATQELVWQNPGTIALDDGSVTTAKLADNAVQTAKILDATITGAKLAPATITAEKLAAGVIPVPPGPASDSTPGLIQLATTAEVLAGTDTTKAVTPGRLVGRTATETRTGLVELATTAEAVTGTDTQRAVTPAGLEARLSAMPALPDASEATSGLVRLATQTEVTTGTDDTKALTPLKLAQRLVAASTTAPGLIELASQSEVTTGTDATRAVTPATLASELLARLVAASETVAGLVELATQGEVTSGTDNTRAVTPLKLATALTTRVPSGTPLSVARYAASGTALEAASGVLTTATTGQLVLGSNTFGLGAANLLVLEREGNTQLAVISSGVTGSAGSTLLLEGTSGTLSAPTPVLANGRLGVINFGGYDGGAFIITASCRVQASELWSGSARGSFLSFLTTFTGTTSPTERLRIDGQGNINTTRAEVTSGLQNGVVLRNGTGPSSDMPDAVQAWVADRNAIAGRASLHLRTENAQSYVLGDVCGIGTLCVMSSLGSGEIYRPLSVNGAALLVGQSSVQERPMGLLEPSWVVSTDATRTARLSLSAYDATAAREGLRLEADGSAARLGFYGGSAVAKPTVTGSRGGNAALASLLTALSSLGLVTDSSTA